MPSTIQGRVSTGSLESGASPINALEGSGSAPHVRPQAAELREQLRLAVETENFELAAELRDRLRVME